MKAFLTSFMFILALAFAPLTATADELKVLDVEMVHLDYDVAPMPETPVTATEDAERLCIGSCEYQADAPMIFATGPAYFEVGWRTALAHG